MTGSCRFLAAVTLSLIILYNFPTGAQKLAPTAAPARNWISLVASADGTKLAAAASYGSIYLSTNSGVTWQASQTAASGSEPQRPWTGLTCSGDGTRLAAVANFSPIFVSTNGGASWIQTGPTSVWEAVAASSDGMKIVAADQQAELIYLSADGGVTWNPASAPKKRWRSLASSADGTKLAAGADSGTGYGDLPAIYVSTNSGVSWMLTSAPGKPWQSITSSADGSKLAAGVYGGLIYLSPDCGRTWRPANVPGLRWGGVASSSDGTHLVAVASEGVVYLSTDSGNTWTAVNGPSMPWQAVATSADGLRVFAGIYDISEGGIYAARIAPTLSIRNSDSSTVISWPSSAPGYTLEQRSDLVAGTWQSVATSPTLQQGQNQVVIDSPMGHCAYRLVQQHVPPH